MKHRIATLALAALGILFAAQAFAQTPLLGKWNDKRRVDLSVVVTSQWSGDIFPGSAAPGGLSQDFYAGGSLVYALVPRINLSGRAEHGLKGSGNQFEVAVHYSFFHNGTWSLGGQ